jgi:plasmid stability protein
MVIEIPDELEAPLKVQAHAHGVSPAGYVREILARELAPMLERQSSAPPFKSGLGLWAKYEMSPLSAEEIDESRAEMLRNFGEAF